VAARTKTPRPRSTPTRQSFQPTWPASFAALGPILNVPVLTRDVRLDVANGVRSRRWAPATSRIFRETGDNEGLLSASKSK
jgi:hypothetical protein